MRPRERTVAALLGVAAVLVLVLLALLGGEGDGRGARPATTADEVPAAARTPEGAESGGAGAEAANEEVASVRAVPEDGSAAGAVLHWVVARPVDGWMYRDGEYPAKRIWLVTRHREVVADAEGRFEVPVVRLPTGARALVFADGAGPLHGVRELDAEVSLERKARVTGSVRGPDGRLAQEYWVRGERGEREDWRARPDRMPDSFVCATGPLHAAAGVEAGASTDSLGRFALDLLPGKNTLSLGDWGEDGSIEVDVPPAGVDLGELRVTAPAAREEEGSLEGSVADPQGRPIFGAEVQLWDGRLEPCSFEATTDARGAFSFDGLRGREAIVWALAAREPHLWLPSQCSGRLRLPCPPIVLRAPRPETFTWLSSHTLRGFLLVRDGDRWAGDHLLDGTERYGLPPGDYHLIVVQHDRILERRIECREPGEIELAASQFRDTTREEG